MINSEYQQELEKAVRGLLEDMRENGESGYRDARIELITVLNTPHDAEREDVLGAASKMKRIAELELLLSQADRTENERLRGVVLEQIDAIRIQISRAEKAEAELSRVKEDRHIIEDPRPCYCEYMHPEDVPIPDGGYSGNILGNQCVWCAHKKAEAELAEREDVLGAASKMKRIAELELLLSQAESSLRIVADCCKLLTKN